DPPAAPRAARRAVAGRRGVRADARHRAAHLQPRHRWPERRL
ncbi:MAG: hypothetical protein AVDCRST_MAG04-1888, partial [uncultured Acetobacteraceae bacterium]